MRRAQWDSVSPPPGAWRRRPPVPATRHDHALRDRLEPSLGIRAASVAGHQAERPGRRVQSHLWPWRMRQVCILPALKFSGEASSLGIPLTSPSRCVGRTPSSCLTVPALRDRAPCRRILTNHFGGALSVNVPRVPNWRGTTSTESTLINTPSPQGDAVSHCASCA